LFTSQPSNTHQRCADADVSTRFMSIRGWTQTQPYVQMQTWTHTCFTECVNFTHVTNVNKAAIFEFLSIV